MYEKTNAEVEMKKINREEFWEQAKVGAENNEVGGTFSSLFSTNTVNINLCGVWGKVKSKVKLPLSPAAVPGSDQMQNDRVSDRAAGFSLALPFTESLRLSIKYQL